MTTSSTCQRCHQPLLQDPTITFLTPSQHSLITSALPKPSSQPHLTPTEKLTSLPPSSRQSAKIWAENNGLQPRSVGESFVLLSDSVLSPSGKDNRAGPSNYAQQLRLHEEASSTQQSSQSLAANLHNILSSRTPISHPLCTECTNHLQVELQKQLEELSKERDAYIAFERGISRNRETLQSNHKAGAGQGHNGDEGDDDGGLGEYDIEGTDDEWASLVAQKERLIKEEIELKAVLAEAEAELEKVRKEEEGMKLEEDAVDREETEFLQSHLSLTSTLKSLKSTLHTSQTHLLLSQSHLQALEQTNVYNDAFQIGQTPLLPDSSSSSSNTTTSTVSTRGVGRGGMMVGTINGLRLGGRPVVEWEEINAAWGLVALCIDRIAVKVGCVFQGYKIVPLGSFSRIEELPPKKGSYELYASSDIALGRVFQNRRFDSGLVALLECLKQLVEFGRRDERGWGGGGIEINKDKISNYSIKLPSLTTTLIPSMSVMGFGSSSSSANTTSPHPATNTDHNSSGGGHFSVSGQATGAAAATTTASVSTPDEIHTKACAAVLRVLKRILLVESENERGSV